MKKTYCDICGVEIQARLVEVKVQRENEWVQTYHFHDGCFKAHLPILVDIEE